MITTIIFNLFNPMALRTPSVIAATDRATTSVAAAVPAPSRTAVRLVEFARHNRNRRPDLDRCERGQQEYGGAANRWR